MSMELLMQYATFALMAVGVLAFLTALITQVIKEMPGLRNIQTNVVAFVTAFNPNRTGSSDRMHLL